MTTRTLTNLRTEVIKLVTPVGKYATGTPTATAAGSLTHTANISLYGNGWFAGQWLFDSAGVQFYITNSTQSSGVLTLNPTGSTPGNGVYYISAVPISLIDNAVNRQLRGLYPVLHRWHVDQGHVTWSPIADPSFTDWTSSTALRHWATASTLARNTSVTDLASPFGAVFPSVNAAASNGFLGLKDNTQTELMGLRGYTVDLYGIATGLSDTAAARFNFFHTLNGTVTHNRTDIADVQNTWELVKKTGIVIDKDAGPLDVRMESAIISTIYACNVWLEGGPPVWQHRLPGQLEHGPNKVSIAAMPRREELYEFQWRPWPYWRISKREDATGDDRFVLEWTKLPPPGYRIRIEGPAPFDELSAGTDTVQVTAEESRWLETKIALDVLDNLAPGISPLNHASIRDQQAKLRADEEMLRRHLTTPGLVGSLMFDL